jgi:hypothetical protein
MQLCVFVFSCRAHPPRACFSANTRALTCVNVWGHEIRAHRTWHGHYFVILSRKSYWRWLDPVCTTLTAHSAQRTAHSAQRTAHSAQRTAHSAQRTAHSAQRTAHSAQRTARTEGIRTLIIYFVITITSTITASMLCEAMALLPGNSHFQVHSFIPFSD